MEKNVTEIIISETDHVFSHLSTWDYVNLSNLLFIQKIENHFIFIFIILFLIVHIKDWKEVHCLLFFRFIVIDFLQINDHCQEINIMKLMQGCWSIKSIFNRFKNACHFPIFQTNICSFLGGHKIRTYN